MTQTSLRDYISSSAPTLCSRYPRLIKLAARAVSHFCKAHQDVDPRYAVWHATGTFTGSEVQVGNAWVKHNTLSDKTVYDLLIKRLTENKSDLTYAKW